MKAMVYSNYGSPSNLRLTQIEKPVLEENELLVKVHASSVNWIDWHFLTGKPFLARVMAGLLKPKNTVLGIDLAGVVEAVGANIQHFRPGEEVFGSTRNGCFAEFVCISENAVVKKPHNISFEEAASVPGAATPALQALRYCSKIHPDCMALINGASGGVGTFAVQMAKAMGAVVTGVCSTKNVDMVLTIGADRVIDYTREDFTDSGEQYDLIFDIAAKRSFSDCKRSLKPQGIYITTEFSPVLVLAGLWTSVTGDQQLIPLPAKPPDKLDLEFMRELLENGKLTPIIDRRFPLSDLPEAMSYLESGNHRGKIVITV